MSAKDDEDAVRFEVVTFPVSEHLLRAQAILENDRDVAFGARVDGPMLDAFERLDVEMQARIDHAFFFGELPA